MSEILTNYDIKGYYPSILIDGCKELGISLSDRQTSQLVQFYRMMYDRNQVMNLTAVTEWDEVQTKHFLDSLLLIKVLDLSKRMSVLDLGTGAGFPGIPLKIVFPHLDFVLVDSLNKRVGFLNEVITALGLTNIQALHGRAEDLGKRKEYRESFDLVVSRAVANLSSLSEYCIPFVRKDGFFISYKAAQISEEVRRAEAAIRILGGKVSEVMTVPLPGTDMERSFVVIRKENRTPSRYPRKAGTPSKEPL